MSAASSARRLSGLSWKSFSWRSRRARKSVAHEREHIRATGHDMDKDAPFHATAEAIEASSEAGIPAVEMETAAPCAFATARQNPDFCRPHATNKKGAPTMVQAHHRKLSPTSRADGGSQHNLQHRYSATERLVASIGCTCRSTGAPRMIGSRWRLWRVEDYSTERHRPHRCRPCRG